MFCSKCGKEIDDSALICTGCGCPTANYGNSSTQPTAIIQTSAPSVTRTTLGNLSAPQPTASAYSDSDKIIIPKIRQYIDEVNSIFIISLLSLVLSLGIGIIFVVVGFMKIKKLPTVDRSIEDPNLIADFQKAQKKLSTSTMMMMISILIFVICIAIGFFGVIFNM